MAEAEAESSSTRDRLSELPNSLLHTILSFLDMRDVVRTTLLSKRWNNLWTTLPFLHFKSFVSFENFVNRALESWKGAKILKFSLNFDKIYEFVPTDIVDSWLRFAIEKQVEHLYINFTASCLSKSESHQLLYSCLSLTKLSIVCDLMQIEGRVQWNRLKSLSLQFLLFSNQDIVNKVISGSPHLEILDLKFLESGRNLNIRSTSLKVLKIHRYVNRYGSGGSERQDTILRISAPNLETLEIFGASYCRCLWNVPCLTNAVLDIRGRDYSTYWDDKSNFWDDKLLEVFLSIHSVEKLTLSAWCFKVLEKLKKEDKVVGDYDHEMFPKLKKMLIKPCET